MKKNLCTMIVLCLLAMLLAGMLTACGSNASGGDSNAEGEAAEAQAEIVDFRWFKPEAFAATDDDPSLLVTSNYPGDPSQIKVLSMERDETILDYTKETYTDYLTEKYSETYGDEVQIFVDSFKVKQVDECPAIRATYFVESSDYWAYVLDVTVVGDKNYEVIYCDSTSDNSWMDEFNISARTMDVVWSDEVDGPDYSKLPVFESASGLSIRMSADMKSEKNENFAAFYHSDTCMLTGLRESFEMLEDAGVCDENTTLEEYIKIIEQNNGIKFEPDSYGNMSACYENDVNGQTFFYYSTVRKAPDAFWLLSFACKESEQKTYLPRFEMWANSVRVDNAK